MTAYLDDFAGNLAGSFGGLFGLPRKKRFTDKMADKVQDYFETAVDTVSPIVARQARMAHQATDRAAGLTASGLEAASERASAARASTAAAAGVVGQFFGAVFSWTWWMVAFAFKTAVLVGVAYAGWQWLHSRQSGPSVSGSGTIGGYTSTYGSMSPAFPGPVATATH